MNLGGLWLILYAILKDEDKPLEIMDDKGFTILLALFLIASIVFLIGILYISFFR